LDQALRKQGRSIDAAKKDFINDALAHEFMGMKLGSKTYVSLTEMRRYYNEHLTTFDQPAQLTWREIRIPIEKGKENQADEQVLKIIDELKQRSDFATLAKRDSKGPTADQGGLWETSPGSFAVVEVNNALENMQPGHVVGPIKAQSNYHILKMESKRAAGPARFDEVQTQIQEKLKHEKLAAASMGFIQDLRKNTLIWTIFDASQSPNAGDNQVKQAQMQPQSQPAGVASGQGPPAASAQSQPVEAGALPVSSAQAAQGQASGLKGVKIGEGGKELHFDLKNRQISDTDPPPAIAPSGPIPPAGIMSGPSQPSPL
ncbi:MAG: peptidylprolyl isomerase, partial [Isosphaeraceae bacterium]